ncbi:transporter substrate-binding domain-containing protein [Pelagicoccus sp. NFK12]|uniref:Transporter substrate-binding domain-containing protein n=1 Tax=Pelagicoccus enzymogenes TaxID=2773457 RepID=A0A927IIJ4_9BACT|nr:transporter substrate-binding domain-containing protein [Pelagicoccus enzymogenes]MBD5780555.1 transporter substrate-binding domain-containing protein [Pelagicoccus enzymogenes]MDQ8199044.1 transporter substrate-binding domain-containing protein [Pelagicoccus enzymogenes]
MKAHSLILAFLAFFLVSCGEKEADDTLVVGMELSYPPFEMSDENNEPSGVSVDLAYALGKSLGRPVRIENIAFAGLISSLKTGKIDLIISSMTATEERAQSIDFSDPYLNTGLCLLVSKSSDIQTIEDADQEGNSIAVKQGTTGHLYAIDNIKNARVLPLDKETAAVVEVTQGKADAFIYDQMSTFRNWKRHPETTRPILSPFKQENWAIGIRKGNEELRQQVNAFLSEFQASGGFETLGERYLSEEKKAFQQMGYPFFF